MCRFCIIEDEREMCCIDHHLHVVTEVGCWVKPMYNMSLKHALALPCNLPQMDILSMQLVHNLILSGSI